MLLSDLKHDFVRTYHGVLEQLSPEKFVSLFREMEEEGSLILQKENTPEQQIRFVYSCDLRYVGQYHEVNVEIKKEEIDRWDLLDIVERFQEAHDRLYGYRVDGTPVEAVNLRVSAIGITGKPRFIEEVYSEKDPTHARKGERSVYLPRDKKFAQVGVFDGERLKYGNHVKGPAIIEQTHTTIFVTPEYDVFLDRYGSYTMLLKGSQLGKAMS